MQMIARRQDRREMSHDLRRAFAGLRFLLPRPTRVTPSLEKSRMTNHDLLDVAQSACLVCALVLLLRLLFIVWAAHAKVLNCSARYSREPASTSAAAIPETRAADAADEVAPSESPAATTVLAQAPGIDDRSDDAELCELRKIWLEQLRPVFLPDAAVDPFLSPPDVNELLVRFLDAERGDRKAERRHGAVQRAAARLKATAAFRAEYASADMHRRGMAQRLLMHGTNAGASVYFGDCGLRNSAGVPVLIGRVDLMTDGKAPGRKPSDEMRPAQHLRGAILVIERAAVELQRLGGGAKGMYILDVGGYPHKEMARHSTRYWDADGEGWPGPNGETGGEAPCAGPILAGHHQLKGLAVLKEALRILERHYPETMQRIFFYRPGTGFRMVFAIFRLWVPKSSRDRFVLVREGDEKRFFAPPPHGAGLRPEDTPRELGGSGPSLDGDRFLTRALERYEREALLE